VPILSTGSIRGGFDYEPEHEQRCTEQEQEQQEQLIPNRAGAWVASDTLDQGGLPPLIPREQTGRGGRGPGREGGDPAGRLIYGLASVRVGRL
jgi:hypothetical protein